MPQMVYSLHFRGKTSASDSQGKLLRATAAAVSASFTTVISADGVHASFAAQAGEDDAIFVSEITVLGSAAFTEKGSISFGEGHSLSFASVGEGHLTPSAQPNVMMGAISWRIIDGEGQFAGASGLITSNFTLSESGELNDYQLGVLYLPEPK